MFFSISIPESIFNGIFNSFTSHVSPAAPLSPVPPVLKILFQEVFCIHGFFLRGFPHFCLTFFLVSLPVPFPFLFPFPFPFFRVFPPHHTYYALLSLSEILLGSVHPRSLPGAISVLHLYASFPLESKEYFCFVSMFVFAFSSVLRILAAFSAQESTLFNTSRFRSK